MDYLIRVFDFFKSIKLAIVLISYIVIFSIIASLIPQGLNLSYYLSNYNYILSSLILFFQLNQFFYSLAFLIPAGLFFINICCCTIYRIYHRHKKKLKRKFGPDLVHIGIIILLLAGVYSMFDREEELIFLDVDESYNLKNGYQIILKDFTIENYENGSIKNWISQIEIRRYGEFQKLSRIVVNQPASFGGINVYQNSYRKSLDVTVSDSQGNELLLNEGGVLPDGDRNFMLTDIIIDEQTSAYAAIFDEFDGRISTGRRFKTSFYDNIGPFQIVNIDSKFISGLSIVEDNSSIFILIAMVLIVIGLIMIYSKEIFKGEKE